MTSEAQLLEARAEVVRLREQLGRLEAELAASRAELARFRAESAAQVAALTKQLSELTVAVAKGNDRITELLAAAQRKKKGASKKDDKPPPTPPVVDPATKATFEDRPMPPEAPAPAPKVPKEQSRPGRHPPPAHLKRDETTVRPERCPCGCSDFEIDDQHIEEKLHIQSHQRVRRTVRKIGRCKGCGQRVAAEAPPSPYERSKVTPEWLAWVQAQLFEFVVPVDRLRRSLLAEGLALSKSFLVSQKEAAADLLGPIDGAHWRTLIEGDHLATDGTGFKVQVPGLGLHHRYFEVYHWGDTVVFQYTPEKGGESQAERLAGFEGTLLVDAESRYNATLASSDKIIEANCHAHPRRKLRDAQAVQPVLAAEAGRFVGAMFGAEDVARERGLTGEVLLHHRQTVTKPLTEQFLAWMGQDGCRGAHAGLQCCCQTMIAPCDHRNPGHLRRGRAPAGVVHEGQQTKNVHPRGARRGRRARSGARPYGRRARARDSHVHTVAVVDARKGGDWRPDGGAEPEPEPEPEAATATAIAADARSARSAKAWTPSQKAQILERASVVGITRAAKEFGVSRFSIYDWRRKLARANAGEGAAPTSGPDPADVERQRDAEVLGEWKTHPGLGPSQVKNQLRRKGIKVSTYTVREIMIAAGYRPPPVKRRPHDRRYEAVRPNHLWHMDFLHRHVNRASTFTLILLDDHSRFVTGFGVDDAERADLVLDTFEQAVARHGRPEGVLHDKGSAFWSWKGISRFTTLLQEMEVEQIAAENKESNGKIEVFNANLAKELFNAHRFYDVAEMRRRLAAHLHFYNHARTSHALGGLLVPADRYFGRADEVIARIEAWATADVPGEAIDLRDRLLDLLRVTSHGGRISVTLMGRKILDWSDQG